ncbi:Ig-like domain-containing protein [Pantoea agglomerans]|uniref:Ig-like domain-containing protein n=1 Tax=Enterobacter agglomerans TaxID=549 RepID=UPI0024133A04|nr:Ig-like domain-containing protein [Pantoea agglomerans]
MYNLIATATSSASADGKEQNTVTAILMNGIDYVSGRTIEFRLVSGNAIFTDGTVIHRAETNTLGAASAAFTDTVNETVSILAILTDDASVYNTAQSTFSGGGSDGGLEVTRVYNDNDKEFSIGGPHYLFIGAKFYIELNHTSASTQWSCDDPNVEVKNVNGLGHVNILGTPAYDIISITFKNSEGSGEYDVACNLYIDDIHVEELDQGKTPSENQYLGLYNEWGDLSDFGWGSANGMNYCYKRVPTSTHTECHYVNLSNGVSSDESSFYVNVNYANKGTISG